MFLGVYYGLMLAVLFGLLFWGCFTVTCLRVLIDCDFSLFCYGELAV